MKNTNYQNNSPNSSDKPRQKSNELKELEELKLELNFKAIHETSRSNYCFDVVMESSNFLRYLIWERHEKLSSLSPSVLEEIFHEIVESKMTKSILYELLSFNLVLRFCVGLYENNGKTKYSVALNREAKCVWTYSLPVKTIIKYLANDLKKQQKDGLTQEKCREIAIIFKEIIIQDFGKSVGEEADKFLKDFLPKSSEIKTESQAYICSSDDEEKSFKKKIQDFFSNLGKYIINIGNTIINLITKSTNNYNFSKIRPDLSQFETRADETSQTRNDHELHSAKPESWMSKTVKSENMRQ